MADFNRDLVFIVKLAAAKQNSTRPKGFIDAELTRRAKLFQIV